MNMNSSMKTINRILTELNEQFFSVMTTPRMRVVFIRHGQCDWNARNLFTGWYDSPLTITGKKEAILAGKNLNRLQFRFDKGFTSRLSRSIETLNLILKEVGQELLPVDRSWRLNERHYGNLTGLNKLQAQQEFGKIQVAEWRRSYDVAPPMLTNNHKHFKTLMKIGKKHTEEEFHMKPVMGESLKMTIERVVPYWNEVIASDIKLGKQVIVAAHGNSLRGIIMHLNNIAPHGIPFVDLPTGMPFITPLTHDVKASGNPHFIGNHKRAMIALRKLEKAKSVKEPAPGTIPSNKL